MSELKNSILALVEASDTLNSKELAGVVNKVLRGSGIAYSQEWLSETIELAIWDSTARSDL